jgi:cell division protein FtsI (penicillin-binding protein 3)
MIKDTPTVINLPPLRFKVVLGALALGFAIVTYKAIDLQILQSDELAQESEARYSRVFEVPAYRGRILDRNGVVLALSTPISPVYAVADKAKKLGNAEIAQLAVLLKKSPEELIKQIHNPKKEQWILLKRDVSPMDAEKIKKLRLVGISIDKAYQRSYSQGEAMAQLLGVTNVKDDGLEGIEVAQNSWLSGTAGSRSVVINPRGEVVEDVQNITAPKEGRDVQLAIDSRLQYIAYRELKAAVETNKAKAGGMVVLDAQTGEVLAMANYPSFDPSDVSKLVKANARNRALIDTFEPGSTLKPFTVGLALDKGEITPDKVIATAGGHQVGNFTVTDAHPNGDLTVSQIIQKSSNVGTSKIAANLPSEAMWRTLTQAGFGMNPNLGFPGEQAGRLRAPGTWRPVEKATMSYGYGLSVNLLQLARGYTVFAGNGDLKPASLLKIEGRVAGVPVFKPSTVLAMREMLEKATSNEGTAPQAQTAGFRVAGKTGTAKKVGKGGYQEARYVSSFVGFAPVSAPRLVIAVMIDEPNTGVYYGGLVAAPAFAKTMADSLLKLNVPNDSAKAPPPISEKPPIREEV